MRHSYDPNFHAAYALALLAEGSTGAARLHLKQAKMLRKTNGGDDIYFDRIGNMIDTAGEPRYFN